MANYYYETVNELNKNLNRNNSRFQLRVLQFNVRGMNCINKFDRVKEMLARYSAIIDVVVLGETWVKEDRMGLYGIDGYRSCFSTRPSSQGGGLAIYVRSTIKFDLIANEEHDGFHHLHVKLNVEETPFNLHAIYRPPSYDLSAFFSKLDSICAKNQSSLCSIVGDVNIPVNQASSPIVNEYKNLLSCYNFAVTNTMITRPASQNVLDHTICSESLVTSVINETIYSDISDHCVVLSTFNIQRPVKEETLEKTIVYNVKLNELFRTAMRAMPDGDANEKLEYVLATYKRLKESCSKKICLKVKVKGVCPWMNFDLWKLIKIKENILRQHKRRPADIHTKDLLKHVSIKVRQAKDQAKKSYYSKLFSSPSQKNVWNNLNKVLGRSQDTDYTVKLNIDGEETSSGPIVADVFNKYFSSIGPQLASSIRSSRSIHRFGTMQSLPNSIFLQPTTEQEVITKINELKNGKSCGVDGISSEFIKIHHRFFACLLRDVFNEGLDSGRFPDCLKIARVTPIHKAGLKSDVSNYRPISVLSSLSKILEKLLVVRLTNFLQQHKLLYNRQYGFRCGASTLTAASELVDEIYSAVDSTKIEGVLFLDLKKAFDTIDHEVLLRKMDCYGVRGKANDLFRSYLTGRLQFVQVNGAMSSPRNITVGVPQGSILGPSFFLIE